MNTNQDKETSSVRGRAAALVAVAVVAVTVAAWGPGMMTLHAAGVKRPPATEFGLGPRVSANGRYVATLEPAVPLRPRQMQTVRVTLRDAEGQAIDHAQITIDGGMPEHGHGLPTRPRVTGTLDNGIYEIEGVRFNMGGWWEFKLAIDGSRGIDTVTFNLAL
ncbi:MAG: FixH family protein [Acidobacteriota bacterium]